MRIMINIEQDGKPRLIEEDIEIALGKVNLPAGEISDYGEDGCFTVDIPGKFTVDAAALTAQIKADTGTIVTVEVESDWS
jgi:hypothetical protein